MAILDITSVISGIVCALISALAGIWTAKKAAKSQILTTAQTSFVKARLDTFVAFETALSSWAVKKDRESTAELYRAANAVLLVCGDDTSKHTHQLLELVRVWEKDYFAGQPNKRPALDIEHIMNIHIDLAASMKADLLEYPVPRPIKNHTVFRQILQRQNTKAK